MIFHVLTLFPHMIRQGLGDSIMGKAIDRGVITLDVVDIRAYTQERHGQVDDYPYGGGAGMLMQAQPVYDAHRAVTNGKALRTVYVTPQGKPFTQKYAREFAREEELVFLCGHYEGIDERVLEEVVTDRISIGDYVLSGGELAAMVMIDATARLLPGVLGNSLSAQEESFHNDLLEYPQYTRPPVWHGRSVPQVLLSGDHRKVEAWRLEQSVLRTRLARPDLYERYLRKQQLICRLSGDKRNHIHMTESLKRGLGEILADQDGEILVYDRDNRICMLELQCTQHGGRTLAALETEAARGRIKEPAGESGSTGWEHLTGKIPEETEWCLVNQEPLVELLQKEGYRIFNQCSQFLYTLKEPLPVGHRDIRLLTMEHIEYLCTHYGEEHRSYLQERIESGSMYGAFVEGVLRGFVGLHGEGSIGFLYVEECCRRQGLAGSLEAYCVNRQLERGWIPYGHVVQGNVASQVLQEKLGFYKAGKTFWWLEKKPCN